jgi:hypothetical protein
MLWPECFLVDRERALVKRLGVAVAALLPVELGEVVEAGGDFGMLWPECPFLSIASARL